MNAVLIVFTLNFVVNHDLVFFTLGLFFFICFVHMSELNPKLGVLILSLVCTC